VTVSSTEEDKNQEAKKRILAMTEEPEVGKIYEGVVKKICDFGAFVEILPGTDGLLHKTEISYKYFRRIEDEIKEGEKVKVKVIEVDRDGKVRLGRKELMPKPDPSEMQQQRPPRYEDRERRYDRQGDNRSRHPSSSQRDGGRYRHDRDPRRGGGGGRH